MSYVAEKEIDGKVIRLTVEQDDLDMNPREWDNLGKMICFHSRYNLGDEHNYSDVEDFLKFLIEDVYSYNELYDVLEPYFKNIYKNLRYEYNSENEVYDILYEDRNNKTITIYSSFECESSISSHVLDAFREVYDDMMIEFIDEYEQILSTNQLLDIIEKSNKYVMLPLYLYDHSGITMNTSGFHCNWDSGQVGWIYASKKTFIDETGYTQDELFNTDKNRTPKTKELVKLKGYDDSYGHYGFGKVIFIDKDIITVDYDFHKIESARSQDNIVTVNVSDIVEVKSDSAKEMLRNEVETYNHYLTGNVYGYILEEKEICECCSNEKYNAIDSCSGFFGTDWSNNGIKDHVGKEYHELVDLLEWE